MKKLFIFASLFFIFGCASSNDKPSAVMPTQNQPSFTEGLKTINISLYSTKHPDKPQPMLIKVISESNEVKEYESRLKSNDIIELSNNDVNEVYYLQLEYVKSGVSEYRDILYTSSSVTKSYFKEFKMGSEYNYDKFDEKIRDAFLKTIGLKDWHQISSPLPI